MAAATVGPIRRVHMICRGTPTTACFVRPNGAGPNRVILTRPKPKTVFGTSALPEALPGSPPC